MFFLKFALEPRVPSAWPHYTCSRYCPSFLKCIPSFMTLNSQGVTGRESFQNAQNLTNIYWRPTGDKTPFLSLKIIAKTKPTACHQVAYIPRGHNFTSRKKEGKRSEVVADNQQTNWQMILSRKCTIERWVECKTEARETYYVHIFPKQFL